MSRISASIAAASVFVACARGRQGGATTSTAGPMTLYVVGYAHLDTQWRWEYPDTIGKFLPATLKRNFALFAKYPHYVFNFTGANRYQMIEEYDPAGFAELKKWVARGRWYPAGAAMEEFDANAPSPESILRQILYGNGYFRRELGVSDDSLLLPDSFGFPAELPSLLAAAGLSGFSTQKLTWSSSAPVGGPDSPEKTPRGIPFNVGLWVGPDGRSVIAALNPGSYGSEILTDLSRSSRAPSGSEEEMKAWPETDWPARLARDAAASGVASDYCYYGTGDTGGAPPAFSVGLLEATVDKGQARLPVLPATLEELGEKPLELGAKEVPVGGGPVRVVSATADQMFEDLADAGLGERLPRYQGDLELTNHSAGSLTSQAAHRRWNHQNELLAGAAEAASVAAAWIGDRPYPAERLDRAWRLVMGGQFHDILAGTATPQAYVYSWNDDVLAANQLAQLLTSATGGVAAALDTRGRGQALVVDNPLAIDREDIVDAAVAFPGGAPAAVRVVGPDGREVPAQLEGGEGESHVVFLARVPSLGFAVYDVQPAPAPAASTALRVSQQSLENARYRVTLDDAGDLASIEDKRLRRELLSAPARLALLTEKPQDWPAWNMDWADQARPPRAYFGGPVSFRVVEQGPARVALEVTREAEGSKVVETIRLSAGGAGDRIEVADAVDWRTAAAALKAVFPLAAESSEATYSSGVGTLRRGNDGPRQFEVASHQWFDLTDRSGSFGVTVLSGGKLGSDKPDDRTLRLTLLYTPGDGHGNGQFYSDQFSQDFGHHEVVYGLAAHAGDWRAERSDWQAQRLDAPLVAFASPAHPGGLGKSFSLLRLSSDDAQVMAVKRAEDGDEVVVRLAEMRGQKLPRLGLQFAAPLVSAREVNAQEQPRGSATLEGGALVTSLTPYQIRSFAVRLAPPAKTLPPPRSVPLTLGYDLAAASTDGSRSRGGFAANGEALPAEMLPATLSYDGIRFQLAPGGGPDAVVARGQTLRLPAGRFDRLYLLAASAEGDRKRTFRVGQQPVELTIHDWSHPVGRWDSRSFKPVPLAVPAKGEESDYSARRWESLRRYIAQHGPLTVPGFAGLTPGFVERTPVAWFASHRHTADGANEPYAYAYLFGYALDIPPGAKTLTLPDDDGLRILAVTAAEAPGQVRPAQPLY
ncbi:MAG: alpha-mannosidase [Myxococcales bacterium]